MIEKVKEQVNDLLKNDNSGHGMDHVNRVLNLSLQFAEKEQANKEIVALIALLHDVDDYKLFGEESGRNLTNAKRIMKKVNIGIEEQNKVCEALKCIGYRKRLKGLIAESVEGKIVSDADMCDVLGANGILRIFQYHTKHNSPFFDKNVFPIENITAEKYKLCSTSEVCHIFEKILKLKGLMLTESGKEEAKARNQITIDFLRHLFEEENVPEWTEYLEKYLKENSI
mgnify:CR=1 FL=1